MQPKRFNHLLLKPRRSDQAAGRLCSALFWITAAAYLAASAGFFYGPTRALDWLRAAGVGDPELRSEVAVAALAGVALARAGGTLTELAGADLDALSDVTAEVLAPLLDL